MSYEPSHRKPPRQERWPNATPGEGWPAYQQGDASPAWEPAAAREPAAAWEPAAAFAGSRNGHGDAWDGRGSARYGDEGPGYASTGYANPGYADTGYADTGYASHGYTGPGHAGSEPWAAGNGYGTTTANPAAGDGYPDGYADGFDGAMDGYAGAATENYTENYSENCYETGNQNGYDSWDSYTQPGHEFTGSAGYLAQEEYPALDPAASSVLVAPDTMGEWWRQADRDGDRGPGDRGPGERGSGERGPLVGAVMGLLAVAVAIGVATFAAAFVRPQAPPVSLVAGVFTDHLPASLRSHLMAHFGAHGQTLLLLAAIALAAMVLGGLARRNPGIGVAGVAVFGLLGAFVAVTRPESRASAVIPWAIGGAAGIVALMWLARASAPPPRAPALRPAYGDGRRRTR
jgi:hypothetical protein